MHGSPEVAIAIGELSDNRFSGLLPDDDVYAIRVYLMHVGAPRNAASNHTLEVGAGGTALKPASATTDAVVHGRHGAA